MKKIRLDKEVYLEYGRPCHINIRSKNDALVFVNREFTFKCMTLLESLCEKYDFLLYVYCFMPDHLHFIISVQGEKSIIELVQAFKSLTTLESYTHGFEGKILQTRFYDHFLRNWEDLERHIKYVLENPIRKGLVRDFKDYPFGKSFI
ncbi:MAG: hypothetical protein A2W25_12480 [candidate division Zixibacteria bacterium RBG_16_53_22]|nr:MAG: hypothetical protein A2W25_12480 [candidate division Zixibacteria bacterium RBG_16_53_22]